MGGGGVDYLGHAGAIAIAVNRRTRAVNLEKKEIDTTALRRWLNDYESALQRHLDQSWTEKRRPTEGPCR
jgi:hypothetical protein